MNATTNNNRIVIWKTKREIAAHRKCSVRTITTLMRRQRLPYVKEGRFVRFDTEACDHAMLRLRTSTLLDRIPDL